MEFEQNVIKANKIILKDKISFVIAHRLNTIKEADLIIFIDNHHIAEMGTHEELVAKQGLYYELLSKRN